MRRFFQARLGAYMNGHVYKSIQINLVQTTAYTYKLKMQNIQDTVYDYRASKITIMMLKEKNIG